MKTNALFFPFLLFVVISLALSSCKKNGTGGKASLHVLVYHNAIPINNSVVYVKFGARAQPSDPKNNYDLKVEGEPDENHVHVEDLRYGNYYLYAVTYDSLTNTFYEGGLATTITWGERKEMKSLMLNVQ